MKEKIVPKRYMLVLQKRANEQVALEFSDDLTITLVPIESFTDKKINPMNKKDSKVKKNTLAFFDAITNKFGSYDEFLASFDKTLYPFDYRPNTSYIGFVNNGYMNTLKLSFNDPCLAQIALVAEGNQINKNDKRTIEAVTNIMDMIEDLDCDFAEKLSSFKFDSSTKKGPKYNFPNDLINSITALRAAKRVKENRCKYGYTLEGDTEEDIATFQRQIVNKLESYKVFREIYRFRKEYLLNKDIEELNNMNITQAEIDIEKESFEKFRKEYEEVRQKEYPRHKQKVKTNQIPGQMSLFD